MFIVSKRNYMVRRADDSAYLIPKDFIGEIPQDVAESDLVQRAIEGGNIAVPEAKKDKELIRRMKLQKSWLRKMISVRMQRNLQSVPEKSDEHVALWQYKPNDRKISGSKSTCS